MKTKFWSFTALLIGSLALSIVPLPKLLQVIRPPFVCLVFLYVQYYQPALFRLSLLFAFGLLLDSLYSTVLGQHVFALVLVSWLASTKARRFQFFTMGQQMGYIALFIAVYALCDALAGMYFGLKNSGLAIGFMVLMAALFWPWLCILGDWLFREKMAMPALQAARSKR